MQHEFKVKETTEKFNKESEILSNQKRALTNNSSNQTKVTHLLISFTLIIHFINELSFL